MTTCKVMKPRKDKSKTRNRFIMLDVTLPRWSDCQTPLGPSLNWKEKVFCMPLFTLIYGSTLIKELGIGSDSRRLT